MLHSYRIFVGISGAKLALEGGRFAVAVCLPRPGCPTTYLLLDTGDLGSLDAPQFAGATGELALATEASFEVAPVGHPDALRLADLIDVDQGLALAISSSIRKAVTIAETKNATHWTYVPFSAGEQPVAVVIKQHPELGTRTNVVEGFTSALVDVEPNPLHPLEGNAVAFSEGWLLPNPVPAGTVAQVPRLTDASVVAHAVFTICSCGLGTLAAAHTPVAFKIQVSPDDVVKVEVSPEHLVVAYWHASLLLYSRTCAIPSRMGDAVGAITAVLIRVGGA